MELSNRVSLRDKANFLFADIKKTPSHKSQICALFEAAVMNHKGIAVFESWHGTYAYPKLMIEMMPVWARRNVTRFYTEVVPASKQDLLDKWQNEGNENGIADYFDSRLYGNSRGMWQYYWLMLQAARDNNIRVVGIDNPDMHSGEGMRRRYSPVFLAPFKNMSFESVVRDDQNSCAADEKFIVYSGENHGTDYGGDLKSIHQRLEIPRMILREGPFSIARHPFDPLPSFSISIPPAPNQDPRDKGRQIRTNPVRWPV